MTLSTSLNAPKLVLPGLLGNAAAVVTMRVADRVNEFNGKRFGVVAPTCISGVVGRGREIVSSTSTAVPND